MFSPRAHGCFRLLGNIEMKQHSAVILWGAKTPSLACHSCFKGRAVSGAFRAAVFKRRRVNLPNT